MYLPYIVYPVNIKQINDNGNDDKVKEERQMMKMKKNMNNEALFFLFSAFGVLPLLRAGAGRRAMAAHASGAEFGVLKKGYLIKQGMWRPRPAALPCRLLPGR